MSASERLEKDNGTDGHRRYTAETGPVKGTVLVRS